MSRYPDSPRPQVPYSFRSNRPFVSGGPEWNPQRRALTRFGLAEADVSYRGNSWAEIQTLYDFYESVRGGAGRFTFVDFNGIDEGGRAWSKLFVEKGDGVWTTADLPTYGIVADPAPVIYENGVAASTSFYSGGDMTIAPGSYLVIPGTGTDGVDSLLAGTHPDAGVYVTISGTCRRAFRRAIFLNTPKNPFAHDVVDSNSQGPATIAEVRR